MWPGYAPMRGRERAVVVLLAAVIAVDLASIASSLAELSLFDRLDAFEPVSDAELDSNDRRQSVIGDVGLGVLIAATVLFIRWLRLAYRNTDALAPGLRRYGHGWAIGAWFVPILNFWRPKKIVNDVWRAGDPGGSPYAAELPLWLNVWWAGWIVSSWLDQRAFGASLGQDTLDELRTVDTWYIVRDCVDALAALLALLVVRRITRRLEDRGAAAPPAWDTPLVPAGSSAGWSPQAPERPGPGS